LRLSGPSVKRLFATASSDASASASLPVPYRWWTFTVSPDAATSNPIITQSRTPGVAGIRSKFGKACISVCVP